MLYSLVDIARQYERLEREIGYLAKMLPFYVERDEDGADFLLDMQNCCNTLMKGLEEIREDDIDTLLSDVDRESYAEWLKNREML